MSTNGYKTQVKNVIAAVAIHNFIMKQRSMDEVLNHFGEEPMSGPQSTNDEGDTTVGQENIDGIAMSALQDSITDQIVVGHKLNH
ncbi:hypothetical protein QJS10_CPB14g00528 [Acorus calamus]|uniref:Uncharacterized protein n=1 Tax=Acorus calamus TaxID=4465 RepID=A0AAV9DFS4_ACOCL|nr:hypothetical protein QJS10_CPB14g00528 [Acorus calamus]